jgi:hypothetical protein
LEQRRFFCTIKTAAGAAFGEEYLHMTAGFLNWELQENKLCDILF